MCKKVFYWRGNVPRVPAHKATKTLSDMRNAVSPKVASNWSKKVYEPFQKQIKPLLDAEMPTLRPRPQLSGVGEALPGKTFGEALHGLTTYKIGRVSKGQSNTLEKVEKPGGKANVEGGYGQGAVARGTGNPRHEPGVATESFNFRNSLGTQKKLMYQNGDIGIIPQEVRDKLAGREFRSFDNFRGELWKEIGNSSFAKSFNKANQSLMNKGFAPRAPKNGHYKSLNTYILHHKQPIEKGVSLRNHYYRR